LATFDFRKLHDVKDSVEIVLEGMKKTESSLTLQILLKANSSEFVAGELYTYGEGPRDVPDTTGRFFPITLRLDITEVARRLTSCPRVEVYVKVLDGKRQEVKNEPLAIESVELRTGEFE